jgi:hypothetical protein
MVGSFQLFNIPTTGLNTGNAGLVGPSTPYAKGGNGFAFSNNGIGTPYLANGNTKNLLSPGTTLFPINPDGSEGTGHVLQFPTNDPNFQAWLAQGPSLGAGNNMGLRIPALASADTGHGFDLFGELLNGGGTAGSAENALVEITPQGVVTFIGSTDINNLVVDGMALFENTAIPEPGSLALLAATAAGAVGYAWRRRRRTASPSPVSP